MLTKSEIKKGYEYLIYIYNDSVSFTTLYHFMHYIVSCQALHYTMLCATAFWCVETSRKECRKAF